MFLMIGIWTYVFEIVSKDVANLKTRVQIPPRIFFQLLFFQKHRVANGDIWDSDICIIIASLRFAKVVCVRQAY